jgi:hypothetical protein
VIQPVLGVLFRFVSASAITPHSIPDIHSQGLLLAFSRLPTDPHRRYI